MAPLTELLSKLGISRRPRVERVEIIQPTPDGTFGGMCPNGRVYNLEVEGNHNYFVERVLVHNCHHSVAEKYLRTIRRFIAKRVGLTATADRLDGKSLGLVFDEAPFELNIEAGIRGGWLVNIHVMVVRIEGVDFSRVRATRKDFNLGDLERLLTEEEPLQAIAVPTVKYAGTRRTMIFAVNRRHAELLARVINRIKPGSAVAIDGRAKESKRTEVLEAFKAGTIQFLINCDLYLEGFNEPSIECVVIARPTKSRARQVQMIGRGTRPSAETGKIDLLVLDFVGNSGKHKLVTTLDALGGDLEPRVREAAEAAVAAGAGVFEAIDQARAQVAAEDARQVEIEEERRRGVVAEVQSHLVEVDPFQPAPAPVPPPVPPVPTAATNITTAQIDALRNFQFTEAEIAGLDRTQATAKLTQAIAVARARGEFCTPKQARLLGRYGVDTQHLSLRSANQLIAAVKKNKWKPLSSQPRPQPPGGH